MGTLDPADYPIGSDEWREACNQDDFEQDKEAEICARAAGHADDWKPVCDDYYERKAAEERGDQYFPPS